MKNKMNGGKVKKKSKKNIDRIDKVSVYIRNV